MILAIWLAERRKISDLARGDLAREAGTPQVLERRVRSCILPLLAIAAHDPKLLSAWRVLCRLVDYH